MNHSEFISGLQSPDLYAECTTCGEEFKLSQAVLFDGQGAFPESAEQRRGKMLEDLAKRMDGFEKRKRSADAGAEKKSIDVGIGKIIEKIIPAHKDFGMPMPDCRPLFEPVDYIVFNGMSNMSIQSVTFLEVKSGNASPSKPEKRVRDAVDNKRVLYRVI